jgi:lactam utilization protein B
MTRRNKTCVRYSDEEMAEITIALKTAGLSHSEYTRRNNLGRRVVTNRVPEVNREIYHELARLRTELQKQGTNINQIAKFAHTHQQLSGESREQINTLILLHQKLSAEVKLTQAHVVGHGR